MKIYVTNNGNTSLEDGWNGERFTFAPGIQVEIPVGAAQHIFGYGVDDKVPHLIRLGWLKMSNEVEAGMKRLAEFSFSDRPLIKRIHASSPVDKGEAGERGNTQTPAKSVQQQVALSA